MNAELVSLTIIAEVSLPFIILSIVLIVILIKSRSNNKEAIRKLILKIKNNQDRQKQNLKEFLIEKLGSDEKTAKSVSKKIINERKFLFRNLISGILDKNAAAIEGLEDDLTRITDLYHSLKLNIQPTESVDVPSDESEKDKEKIDELKKEVKTLKHEVHVTLTTLNNIFGEFSSMFGEEVPDRELSVDQIITAMEAFSTKSDSEPEQTIDPVDIASDEIEELEELDVLAEMEEDINFEEELQEQIETSTDEEPNLEDEISDITENIPEIEDEDKTELDFSIDSELDDIDSALDDLELGASPDDDDFEEEPSWDDAFEESGDKK